MINRIIKTFDDIWEGLKFVFRTAPIPATFLVLWVSFLLWVVTASWS